MKFLLFRNKICTIFYKVQKHIRLSFIDKPVTKLGRLVSSRMDSKWICHFIKIATKSEHNSDQR